MQSNGGSSNLNLPCRNSTRNKPYGLNESVFELYPVIMVLLYFERVYRKDKNISAD